MTRRLLPAITLCLLVPGVAAGQGPPCPEFQVNTYTPRGQGVWGLASDGAGNFVVTWDSYLQDGSDWGVFARRYEASGAPRGPEFQVNTHTTGTQIHSEVAAAADGSFVVAWQSFGQDGHMFGIFARRFDGAGVPQGPEFQVNTYTTGLQNQPSVAMDPAGDFVVAWMNYGTDGPGNILARRFDAAGNPRGGEFQVNSYTGNEHYGPSVAMDASGAFVVVWVSMDQDGSLAGVFGQRYDSSGAPRGPEFQVNTYTTGYQDVPRVASDGSGNFVVVWSSPRLGTGNGVFGQRFDASGLRQGPEFQLNSGTTGLQGEPGVAFDSAGGFVAVWSDLDGSFSSGILGRRFSSAGVPEGPNFVINTYTGGGQFRPRVSATTHQGFVAAWTSDGQDGDNAGAYASVDCARLYPVTPCRLADTRRPLGPGGGPPLGANTTRSFPITGACGVPADARAVAINMTAVSPSDAGNLRLFPTGQAAPLASALNFAPGRTRANNAVAPLGSDGQVSVRCEMAAGSTGSTNLVLDVYGYFKR